ncbi:transcriptional regulator, DeoR family [Enterococcus faecalis 13-SD-W-01]|nr:transcriptional regulator, DeoR family [Enterococcus faecalis 13-SD-W-01]
MIISNTNEQKEVFSMMKEERQKQILQLLDLYKIVKVSDIREKLNVTEMTVRRDLQDLEDQGLLIRVHGGAKSIEKGEMTSAELSHIEKQTINLEAKKEIAQLIAQEIKEGDTVFLGSGTTIELVYDFMETKYAKIVTNSIYVFEKFKNDPRFDLVLIGGTYRPKTGAFVGTIANDFVSTIHVNKAFIGVNGICENSVYNSNEDEGLSQSVILNSAQIKYIVADHTKFNKRDFYRFYDLNNIDHLITDSQTSTDVLEAYNLKAPIIQII